MTNSEYGTPGVTDAEVLGVLTGQVPVRSMPVAGNNPPPCSNHREVQHRDRKPPWCNACGWRHAKPSVPATQIGKPREGQ